MQTKLENILGKDNVIHTHPVVGISAEGIPTLFGYPVVESDALPKIEPRILVFGPPLVPSVTHGVTNPATITFSPPLLSATSARVTGLIPARAGSKGILGKNMKLLGGKPLIQWTIEAAKEARCLTQTIVTTEDPEIANFARDLGVGVILRPKELAQDHVQLTEVYLHAYRILEMTFEKPDTLVLLPPTSPFRTHRHIDEAYDVYVESGKTAFSVYADHKFHWKTDISAYPIEHDPEHRKGRQWVQKDEWLYVENGAIWIIDGNRFSQDLNVRPAPYALYDGMTEEESMDVDTPYDFWLCEQRVEWLRQNEPAG